MTSSETKAKRLKILDMLAGYSSLLGKDLSGLTSALCDAAESYPLDVVTGRPNAPGAIDRLIRDCKYPPTPSELIAACDIVNSALHPKVVELYNGLIDMDFGHGRIDMRGLTTAEQDTVIKNHGMIGGKNAALLSLEEKREALRNPAIAADTPKARIRRMTDK